MTSRFPTSGPRARIAELMGANRASRSASFAVNPEETSGPVWRLPHVASWRAEHGMTHVWTAWQQARPGRQGFASVILGFDAWLRRRNGVYEYSAHPHCAFRMQVLRVGREVFLPDGTHLRPGDRVIDLHVWNEQFPCFPVRGATLSWARRIDRHVDISLRELARYLAASSNLADIRAIRADTRLAGSGNTAQLLRICRRYGLERGS